MKYQGLVMKNGKFVGEFNNFIEQFLEDMEGLTY